MNPCSRQSLLCAYWLGEFSMLLPPLSLTALLHSQGMDDSAIRASLFMVGHKFSSCGRLGLCKQASSSACSSRSSFCHAAASVLQEQTLADAAAWTNVPASLLPCEWAFWTLLGIVRCCCSPAQPSTFVLSHTGAGDSCPGA